MPHQVVKDAGSGIVGDLAKITRALEDEGYNILAAAAGEVNHVGIIAMLFDPDVDKIPGIVETIQKADLGAGRTPEDVEALPDVHILLNDTPGQLRRAAEALGDINIETVVTIDKQQGKARRESRVPARRLRRGREPTTRRSHPDPRPQALGLPFGSALRARLARAHPDRDRRGLDAVVHAELVEDVGDVDARGLRADEQRLGDLGVRAARGDQLEDLPLAGPQAEDLGRAARPARSAGSAPPVGPAPATDAALPPRASSRARRATAAIASSSGTAPSATAVSAAARSSPLAWSRDPRLSSSASAARNLARAAG